MTLRILSIMALILTGCSSPGDIGASDRAHRLMRLAEQETGHIASPSDRLTRQLNIADMQNSDLRSNDARRTLAAAARTTRESKPNEIDLHTRLAGWVSISELSRAARHADLANEAITEALRLSHAVDPVTERVQYVRGVADELKQLRGKSAAAALLKESGSWAAQIDSVTGRRTALTAISSDLFALDDDAGGLAVLYSDPDPAWRTDTLTQLARAAEPVFAYGSSVSFAGFFSADALAKKGHPRSCNFPGSVKPTRDIDRVKLSRGSYNLSVAGRPGLRRQSEDSV